MAFVIDKEELKPGLIIFRRSDVDHRNWYCRIKMPKADRYKTVSLKTPDKSDARERAYDQDADIRFRLKHDVPIFNRPFRDIAKEYLATQEARAKRGEISAGRPKKMKAVIEGALDDYVGSTQIHLIGDELWGSYPAWRRENGAGRNTRNGTRQVSEALAKKLAAQEAASREKAMLSRGFTKHKPAAPKTKKSDAVPFISDATIRFEMSIFGAVMNYAVKKRFVAASQRFDDRPKLKIMRRDEFTLEEYRKLHTKGRKWIKEAIRPSSTWYRTVAYCFILIMCNTGMRPSEARNLRWRDISTGKDREGRELVVLSVRGKGKSRKLIAPASVAEYLDRIRKIAVPSAPGEQAARPDDPVFTTHTGESAKSLYQALIHDLLQYAELLDGPSGLARSTYCFRHTFATFRLSEGVDVYLLAEQMGTSVKMIQDHYGHVNTIKHADRVLQGIGGWDPIVTTDEQESDDTKAAHAAAAKVKTTAPSDKRRGSRRAS
jgi:integrase